MLNYDIIICTKDRADDFSRFQQSLLLQSVLPDNLIVVDASTTKNNLEEKCENKLFNTGINFIYLAYLPGLTRQRNVGCKHISNLADIVFFFDDDVSFCDPFYIEKILIRFSEDVKNEIGCIFGKITNNSEVDQSKNRNGIHNIWFFIMGKFIALLSRLFLIASSKVYNVLPSGMNTANQNKTNNECFVDWQPGCSMSFRREVLEKYHFDESLVGYSMREDLDMSYRVSKKYKILYLPSAQLLHLESPIQRLNSVRFGEKDIESWHWFVWKNLNMVKNKILFYWSVFGYLILLLLSQLLLNDKDAFYRFKGGIKALLRILRLRY